MCRVWVQGEGVGFCRMEMLEWGEMFWGVWATEEVLLHSGVFSRVFKGPG